MPLTATPRATLVPRVIEQLRAQITSGEWPVGTRIPTEPQLAAALGVGRNTVREAVRALAHAGLLECRQGSGTYVRSGTELAGAVARRVADGHLADVLEVRRALEVEAARLAALRRSAADLARLDEALARRETAWRSGEPDRFVTADVALHVAVVAAAHNRVLADLYADFSAAVRDSLADHVGDDLSPDRHVDHARLVAAIRAGDPTTAAEEAGHFLTGPDEPATPA